MTCEDWPCCGHDQGDCEGLGERPEPDDEGMTDEDYGRWY